MSLNTATYVLETTDGFNVLWGAGVECSLETPIFRNFLQKTPYFRTKEEAFIYAEIIEYYNKTEFGIVVLPLSIGGTHV